MRSSKRHPKQNTVTARKDRVPNELAANNKQNRKNLEAAQWNAYLRYTTLKPRHSVVTGEQQVHSCV